MLNGEIGEDYNKTSDDIKFLKSKIFYRDNLHKSNNLSTSEKTQILIFNKRFIFIKFFVLSLLIFFLSKINDINKNYYTNKFNSEFYSLKSKKFLDKNNNDILLNYNETIKIIPIQEETYDAIENRYKNTYLTENITNLYNNYIKLCLDNILIDKTKYPLLKSPKISVIIPLYNAVNYLYYALRSIQNQKMKDIEIILIDDCSKDDTLIMVNQLMEEDPRIRLIKNEKNRKILYSKSMGALNANGKYILQLDQDDLFIRDDLFDILYNEAEKNNLDLTQIRDIFVKNLYLKQKTRVNIPGRHLIYLCKSYFKPISSHYKTNSDIKKNLFTDGRTFPLWGLLIKTDIYKKAIYYLWPVIMTYEFTFYEDFIVSSIIVVLSKRYKFLNHFALVHLEHKNSASMVYYQNFYLSLLVYANIFYKYYIKYNPEDINIAINLIKKYKFIYEPSYKYYHKLFEYNILQILSNQYLTENDKKYLCETFNITAEKFKRWSSYEYLMNSSEYNSILNFQNLIINSKENNNLNLNQPKISIIIYCTEFLYLQKTINSIQYQNFDKFEILLIYDNDVSVYLNQIKNYIKIYKNIELINNKKKKGILYSYSKGITSSHGEYILAIKPGEILANEYILNELYNIMINNQYNDILEFNLLLNNCDNIKNNSLSLYRCKHFNTEINLNLFKYNKNYLNIEQEKDILSNKLVNASFYKNIINKYKLLDYHEIIYNYYDDIILFLFSKEMAIFKRNNIYGIIQYINNIRTLDVNNIMNKDNQKVKDSIFYINFLFENTDDTFDEKKIALEEFYNILSIIYNKFNKPTDESNRLIQKFLNCNYISNFDKNNLKFYFYSLLN